MTRPEISIATMRQVLDRQGNIPMTPRDEKILRDSIDEMEQMLSHLTSAYRNRTEIVTDLDVLSLARAGSFPARSNVVQLRGRVGA